jgi:medium-chain acyl-[acyl-carrier-protein] hydrolase
MSAGGRWLQRWNGDGPARQPRMFCFHHAGGGAAFFREWPQLFGDELEIVAVQLPGRGNRLRESPYVDMRTLVGELTEALAPELERPCVFFGHSLGALLAFEVSRALRRARASLPARLFVSGRGAPSIPESLPPLENLSADDLVRELQRRYMGIPAAVLQNRDVLNLLLPTLRADLRLLETYTYQPEDPLPCPVSAFGGRQDPNVTAETLAAWQRETTGAFRLRLFPGGHFFPQEVPGLLAAATREDLAGVLGPSADEAAWPPHGGS